MKLSARCGIPLLLFRETPGTPITRAGFFAEDQGIFRTERNQAGTDLKISLLANSHSTGKCDAGCWGRKDFNGLIGARLWILQYWPAKQYLPTGVIVAWRLLRWQTTFRLDLRPMLQEGIHTWDHKPGQGSWLGRVGPYREPSFVTLLNRHVTLILFVFKIGSHYIALAGHRLVLLLAWAREASFYSVQQCRHSLTGQVLGISDVECSSLNGTLH